MLEPEVVADRYRLLEKVGEGGMGAVYRAWDEELDEVVALKLLRPERVSSPEAQERFRWEVKLARRVTHPNVARIYELGRHGAGRFLTMAFVDGPTLAERIEVDGPLSLGALSRLAQDVAAALFAAHEAQVVHLDVKPGNVLLTREGRAIVTDFGLAGALEQAAASSSGGAGGTPAYMAPEQIEGAQVSLRTDLFSFGVLLFEAASGRLPWKKPTVYATLMARMLEAAPRLETLRPDLPPAVSDVVARCLAPEPARRPASAVEVSRPFEGLDAPAPDVAPAAPRRAAAPGALEVHVAEVEGAGPGARASDLRHDLVEALGRYSGLRVRTATPRGAAPGLVVRPRVAMDDDAITLELSLPRGEPVRLRGARSEALGLDDEAAAEVARRLGVRRAVKARPAALPPAALEGYLAARRAYRRFEPRAALEALDVALLAAPAHPLIRAAWALATLQAGFVADPDPGPEGLARALEVAREVVAEAPHLAEAHVAEGLAQLALGRTPEGARALRRATSAAPSHAGAQGHVAALLAEAGRPQDALHRLDLAEDLDPAQGPARWARARILALEPNEAALRALFRSSGKDAEARLLAPEVRLLTWLEDRAGLEARLAELDALPDTPDRAIARLLARAHLRIVPTREAYARLAQRASDSSARRRALGFQLIAELAAARGDLDSAKDAVARADADGLADIAWLDGCPLFGALRRAPGFEALRAPIRARADEVLEAIWGPD